MSGASRSVFAPLTAPGRGGIAVVRAIGPAVADALAACFRPAGGSPSAAAFPRGGPPGPPRRARGEPEGRRAGSPAAREIKEAPRAALPGGRLAYGHVLDTDGRVLDEVILHRAGPDTWEVNCHGGPAAVAAVCDRLASLGLVQVDSGALLAAEGAGPVERAARRLLRTAATPLAARILLDQFVPDVRGGQESGKRGGSPYPPRARSTDSQGAVGAETHRAKRPSGALETAVAEAAGAIAAGRGDEAAAALAVLLDRWATCGRYLAEPPRIVLAGRPNVGKSTLLNRLAGRERAITHPEPGTTRDYVETVAAMDGLPVVLVDTAGVRETLERIEREGVARARRQAAGAALVVYLLDAEVGATPEDEATLAQLAERGGSEEGKRGESPHPPRTGARWILVVWNKADLADGPLGGPGAMAISAETGEGLDDLRRTVLERLAYRAPPPGTAVPFVAEQADALRRAAAYLADGRADEAAVCLASVTRPRSGG